MKYLSRIADNVLQERLEAFGAILIEGPIWTGKTTTAEHHASSVLKMQDHHAFLCEEYQYFSKENQHVDRCHILWRNNYFNGHL